jgi:hypothetical protein
LTATYTYVDEDGKTRGTVSHSRRGTGDLECYWLLDRLALDVAVDFLVREAALADELSRSHPSAPTTPPAPALPPPPCPESRYAVWPPEAPSPQGPDPDPPKRPDKAPFAVRLGVSAWPELVVAGFGSFGVSAEVGARYRFVSLGVEAHGDPALSSLTYPGVGSVSFARLSGALVLCAHLGWFAACGVGDVGRLFFPNHVSVLPASTLYGAAGVRAGLEFPVVPSRFFVRAAVDLRAPIHPASYSAASVNIFESAGLGVGLGLGLLVEFPR